MTRIDLARQSDLGGQTIHATCQGRLTLTSGLAVTITDVTAATSVFFTPHKGNQIGTYDGTTWGVASFTEKTLSLSGLTADTNYDIFIVDGTLALEAVAWTNATTRATALVSQDGVLVQSGAATKRYLGTIRITSTGQTEDSLARRFVWNHYNRVARSMLAVDGTNSWSYGTATWRAANNTTTDHQVACVVGLAEDEIRAQVTCRTATNVTVSNAAVGIGVDSTSVNSAQLLEPVSYNASDVMRLAARATYAGVPGIGYHALNWLEYATASIEYYGDAGTPTYLQSGLTGTVWA